MENNNMDAVKKYGGLEKIAENKDFGCIKSILQKKIFPIMAEMLDYAQTKSLKKYAIILLRRKLNKNRRHYIDHDVYRHFAEEYAKSIKEHFELFKRNSSRFKGLQTNEDGENLSKISMKDIDYYLNDDNLIFD
jgi:hypothetical protein